MSDQPIVELQGLRKEYAGVVALAGMDLTLQPGEIYGLIGPNGAGKTTLLRLLATTLEPTLGRAMICGQDVWADPVATRGRIGYMPDFFSFYNDLTVFELLTYFGLAHGMVGKTLSDRVEEVIALSGMTEKRDTFCKGLSRGMVQRIGMARAVLHKPKLLLLDEPASGLDPLARKRLFDVLRTAHAEGATVIISSHILGELSELCTSVGILSRGRLLNTGPTRQVIQSLLKHRKIELTVLPDSREAACNLLAEIDGTGQINGEDAVLRFNFQGEDSDLAELHRRLVAAGVGVVTLAESASSLHEAYFAIAEKEGTDAQS